MINGLSIDVEEYFNVEAFADRIHFEDWDKFESRVENSTNSILAILRQHNVKATFFVLGWVAERHPDLIRGIHAQGHEVACHGYAHKLIYSQTPDQFKEDLRRSRRILEDIIGEKVIGYRAPSYSITKDSLWALDILISEGFLYDSSIFPIMHDRYGIPDGARFIYEIGSGNGQTITEIPLSTVVFLKKNIPIAGGGYMRLLPYSFIRWGIQKINLKENKPAIIYLHPWEIDVEQPRLQGSLLSKFRHYVNLAKMERNLRYLLRDFRFAPVRDLISN
ncbi:MAG: DUF3473 domain-containing protein [Nitrospirae bacterium]|nr:DUF3473 domain-containing protein [Nitrospirota bacterium]